MAPGDTKVAKSGANHLLPSKGPLTCAIDSSSSTLLDGRRSLYSFDLAPSNSTAPLAQDEVSCFSIDNDKISSARSNEGRERNGSALRKNSTKKCTRRQRSTTALLFKPSVCGRILTNLASRLWPDSEGHRTRAKDPSASVGNDFHLYLSSCKNRNITPSCLMVFGACLSFILIISAYLLGRYLSDGHYCPSNAFGSDGGDDVSFEFNYALLRDRLVHAKTSKSPNHLSPVVRLQRRIMPIHYDLIIDFSDLHNRRVKGTMRVLIQCLEATQSFNIHATFDHVTISKVSILSGDPGHSAGKESVPSMARWNRTDQLNGGDGFSIVNVTLDFTLQPGASYDLEVEYTAVICGTKSGVACYEDGQRTRNGYATIFASTKFEPTAARTFLPCFDEPDMKATFNITVVRVSDMNVLTNTPTWKKMRTRHGQIIEHFETTPRMSTYLLGFTVGPYIRQEKRTDRGVNVAVWTRREDRSKGEYALEYAARMLQIIEDYFGIDYVLPKLDLVASPEYPVGAMENWGLLIFHERALLYLNEYRLIGNPGGHGVYQPYLLPKFLTSKIIVHELLHQWFGNLVTMHWWSEIWLNEGFATFFIYQFLKEDYPVLAEFHQTWKLADAWQRQTHGTYEFPYWTQFTEEKYALVRNFKSDEEIYEAFDEHHLYAKGASVVRMIWHLLGEKSMKSGLQQYLSNNAFLSVDRHQLWDHLGYSNPPTVSLTNHTVGHAVESWLINPGFPEVKITSRNGALHLEQGVADFSFHCAYLPTDFLKNETKNYLWSIPFTYVTEGDNSLPSPIQDQSLTWINNRSLTITDPKVTLSQWVLANPDFHFPYRVNYDLDNWSKLINQLKKRPDHIPVRSRTQLILDSAFFLKETDDLPVFLDLLGYLRKETDLLPLILGLREIYTILDQYKASSIYPLLIYYFRPVIEQASKMRFISERDAELDAVWWLDDSFSLTLKLLQCSTRHRRCRISREEVQGVLSLPGNGQVTDKLIPICEYLKRNYTHAERQILLYWLDQERSQRRHSTTNEGTSWRQDVLFMVSCVHDKELIQKLVDAALARGDLEFLATSLSSTFTLNYNDFLAIELWTRLGNANVGELDRNLVEVHLKSMLRSVRTLGEFELAKKSLSTLHFDHSEQFSFIVARLAWQQRRMLALEDWLMLKLESTFP